MISGVVWEYGENERKKEEQVETKDKREKMSRIFEKKQQKKNRIESSKT